MLDFPTKDYVDALNKSAGISLDNRAGDKEKEVLQSGFYEMAQILVTTVPSGRELSAALLKLEEVMLCANAGLSRRYGEK